jgi:hypothetical protein
MIGLIFALISALSFFVYLHADDIIDEIKDK